jgi:hypothetical protein
MVITPAMAVMVIAVANSMINKAVTAYNTKEPQNLQEELEQLEKCKLAPSEDIIAEADKAMGKG